jgi:penicillin amidase
MPVGFTPIRPNWNGLLPVPGDGRYEWAGFLDPDHMPVVMDPPAGFVATANEMNLPADWPHDERPVGFEWAERSRAARIHEALKMDDRHSVAASCALQTDVLSVPARRIGRLIAPLAPPDADAGRGLALLRAWDHRLDVGSAAAALFEVWWTKHLKPGLIERLVTADARKLMPPGDVETLLQHLEQPTAQLGTPPERARDDLLLVTLSLAMRTCANRMGDDPGAWAWGRLHHGYFQHALSGLAEASERPAPDIGLDVGPWPKGGSASTPMHAGYRPSDFRVVTGASVRLVMDVHDWDRSVCINAPGQSGDPRSPHYRDLAPLWAAGKYIPMLYSRAAVEGAVNTRLLLSPTQ